MKYLILQCSPPDIFYILQNYFLSFHPPLFNIIWLNRIWKLVGGKTETYLIILFNICVCFIQLLCLFYSNVCLAFILDQLIRKIKSSISYCFIKIPTYTSPNNNTQIPIKYTCKNRQSHPKKTLLIPHKLFSIATLSNVYTFNHSNIDNIDNILFSVWDQ